MKIRKFFGLCLCAIGIHRGDVLIENEYAIGYGCPRCETMCVTYFKINIPPPPKDGQTAEEYAEDVKKYKAYHKDRYNREREAIRSALR
jgi:hypothetical protein